MIGLVSTQAPAQAFLGESSRIVAAYLGLKEVKYDAVQCSRGLSLIIAHVDGGTAVYYFKDDECVEYSLVKYNTSLQATVARLDRTYPREGEYWCSEAENACIGVASAQGVVFVNTFQRRDWYLY